MKNSMKKSILCCLTLSASLILTMTGIEVAAAEQSEQIKATNGKRIQATIVEISSPKKINKTTKPRIKATQVQSLSVAPNENSAPPGGNTVRQYRVEQGQATPISQPAAMPQAGPLTLKSTPAQKPDQAGN